MFATGVTVSLAERIIYDSCLVLLSAILERIRQQEARILRFAAATNSQTFSITYKYSTSSYIVLVKNYYYITRTEYLTPVMTYFIF